MHSFRLDLDFGQNRGKLEIFDYGWIYNEIKKLLILLGIKIVMVAM